MTLVLAARLEARTVPEPNTGCWLWFGAMNGVGYGILTISRDGWQRPALAHRLSYEQTYGPIPDGLVVDHLCRVPRCINPKHLEAVTVRVNLLRGVNPAATNARKTQCDNGHPFTDSNTYIRPGYPTHRACRACHRINERRRKGSR